MWDDKDMVRPPLGPVTMAVTVKFRLSDTDLKDLHAISRGDNISETLRRLIREEVKRTGKRG